MTNFQKNRDDGRFVDLQECKFLNFYTMKSLTAERMKLQLQQEELSDQQDLLKELKQLLRAFDEKVLRIL